MKALCNQDNYLTANICFQPKAQCQNVFQQNYDTVLSIMITEMLVLLKNSYRSILLVSILSSWNMCGPHGYALNDY